MTDEMVKASPGSMAATNKAAPLPEQVGRADGWPASPGTSISTPTATDGMRRKCLSGRSRGSWRG
jgi:hypothetical protein